MPNTDVSTEKVKFKFDRSFQEKILHAMIVDKKWAAQFSEVLNVDYFEYAYIKLIADKYTQYHRKYKEFPSNELLFTIIRNELKQAKDVALTEDVKDFFGKLIRNENLGDHAYVKEKSLDFCKRAALQRALVDCVDSINNENYDKVVTIVKKAIASGNSHTTGLDLTNDIDARYSETYRNPIPTGIPEIDDRPILNGGLSSGELGIIVAPTGVGKSHILVHLGASALLAGKNVLHYTFELNERAVGVRYDSHLLDIPSIDCPDHKDKIKTFYKGNADKLGRLIIKYYPTSTASTTTIDTHVDKLLATGFVPDIIIVDYAGIMRSCERKDLLRLELKMVCEELRSFADEKSVPIWTALQSNKEGADKEVVDLTNMAESYGQAHVADFVMGVNRPAQQKATGFGHLFIAKNRAGIDGKKYSIRLDTAKSKLRILTQDEAEEYKMELSFANNNRSLADRIAIQQTLREVKGLMK